MEADVGFLSYYSRDGRLCPVITIAAALIQSIQRSYSGSKIERLRDLDNYRSAKRDLYGLLKIFVVFFEKRIFFYE